MTPTGIRWKIDQIEDEIKKYERKVAAATTKTGSKIPTELLPGGEYFKGTKIEVNGEIFKLIEPGKPVTLKVSKTGGSQYNPMTREVQLQIGSRQAASRWEHEAVVYHEYGHAIDFQNRMTHNIETRAIMDAWKKKLMEKVEYAKTLNVS